jgi:hypothetical protein
MLQIQVFICNSNVNAGWRGMIIPISFHMQFSYCSNKCFKEQLLKNPVRKYLAVCSKCIYLQRRSKNILIKNTTIRSLAAAFMLLVFAFSVTPTIVLHNWLANHKDSVRKLPANNQQQVSQIFFNCNCDNIVATSPFTEPDTHFQLPPVLVFSVQPETKLALFLSSPHFFFSLRGPPVV